MNLRNKTIALTGPSSMLGKNISIILEGRGANVLPVPHKNEEGNILCDLTQPNSFPYGFWNDGEVNALIHLASKSGGILANAKEPYEIYRQTMLMGINVFDECIYYNTKLGGKLEKIVFVISSCALCPSDETSYEDDLYQGTPHPSIECHGAAKRGLETLGRQLQKQYGIEFVSCIGQNSFGAFDKFNLGGKVIGGIIQRMFDAKENGDLFFDCYGSGKPLREFLYAPDFAEGVVQVLERYSDVSPINLTSGTEISIGDLAHLIAEIIGYEGNIQFDTSKPDGQMRKRLSKEKMDQYLDVPITNLKEALTETISWYSDNRNKENL